MSKHKEHIEETVSLVHGRQLDITLMPQMVDGGGIVSLSAVRLWYSSTLTHCNPRYAHLIWSSSLKSLLLGLTSWHHKLCVTKRQ